MVFVSRPPLPPGSDASWHAIAGPDAPYPKPAMTRASPARSGRGKSSEARKANHASGEASPATEPEQAGVIPPAGS